MEITDKTGVDKANGGKKEQGAKTKRTPTRRIALYGLLVALALILSYVESLVPAFFAVPGMKLGLTNVVVLVALYTMDEKSAISINVLRILLVSFLFGNGVSFLYSLAGGVLSGLIMILLKKTGSFRMVTVSIAGGIAHNVGQILMAMAILETTALAYYLLILWFSGMASGIVIGIISAETAKRVRILTKNV